MSHLSNTSNGFPAPLGACSGGPWFHMEAMFCGGTSGLAGSQCALMLQAVLGDPHVLFHPLAQMNSNGSLGLMETKGSLQVLASHCMCKPTKTQPLLEAGVAISRGTARQATARRGKALFKVTRWHTDV